MYDPIIGRFLEEDPIGLDAGDMDLYRFVGNNPTNYVDPSGLFRQKGEKGDPSKPVGLSDYRDKGFVEVWSRTDGTTTFQMKCANGAFFYGKLIITKDDKTTEQYWGRCLYEPGINGYLIGGDKGKIMMIRWYYSQGLKDTGEGARIQKKLIALQQQMNKDGIKRNEQDKRFRELLLEEAKAGKLTTFTNGKSIQVEAIVYMWPEGKVERLISDDGGKTWKWVEDKRVPFNYDNPEPPKKKCGQ